MAVEPLWREALGRRLRDSRRRQRRTLDQTARRAGISTQYLSEVERGRKDPSSEIVAAIAGALGHTLGEIAALAAADLVAGQRSTAAIGTSVNLNLPLPMRWHAIDGQRARHGHPRPLGSTGPVALAA